MATLKVLLHKRKADKQGLAPVVIRITKERKSKFLYTGVKVKPVEWSDKHCLVKKTHANASSMNAVILKLVKEAESLALRLEVEEKKLPQERMKEALKPKEAIGFLTYADTYIQALLKAGKMGTYTKASAVISKLKTYMRGEKTFPSMRLM